MAETKSDRRMRPDGRKPLLVYLDPKLILALKREALEKDTHAYLLIEERLRAAAPTKD
jgi:hypothetical protein